MAQRIDEDGIKVECTVAILSVLSFIFSWLVSRLSQGAWVVWVDVRMVSRVGPRGGAVFWVCPRRVRGNTCLRSVMRMRTKV